MIKKWKPLDGNSTTFISKKRTCLLYLQKVHLQQDTHVFTILTINLIDNGILKKKIDSYFYKTKRILQHEKKLINL